MVQPTIPIRCKRNKINSDLHQVFKNASDFDAEVSIIRKKYLDAGYLIGFIKSVISDFKQKKKVKTFIVKKFIDRTESFTADKIMLLVLWSIRNIKPLFPHKDNAAHPNL